MTVIMPKSVFYHVPKTGGTSIRRVLPLIIEGATEYKKDTYNPYYLKNEHILPKDVPETKKKGKLSFAFVRNPLTWYQSYWKYKARNNSWDPHSPIDRACGNTDFSGFVRKTAKEYPEGLLTGILKLFDPIDFWGKIENLVEDLGSALEKAGETYDPRYRTMIEHINSSDSHEVDLGPEELETIKKQENWVFKKFYP